MARTKEERIEVLLQLRDALQDKILYATINNKLPNYELDGQRFDWGDYMDILYQQLAVVDLAIQRQGKVTITWLGKEKISVAPTVTTP